MKVQVLAAAMHQQDHSLLEKMNIQSDVIVGNQCDRNQVETFAFRGHEAKYLNFAERGVGLNRNNALMRADADVVLFADDDMRYHDGYVGTVERAFDRLPQADVLIFNIDEEQKDMAVNRFVIREDTKVGYLNFLRYGTVRIAARLRSVREAGVLFHLNFGGGTEHRHGEDNLFLASCLKSGLKVYAVPEALAVLKAGKASTWNTGYDAAYLADQGALYRAMSRRWWRLLCLQDAVRKTKRYKMNWRRAYRLMTARTH